MTVNGANCWEDRSTFGFSRNLTEIRGEGRRSEGTGLPSMGPQISRVRAQWMCVICVVVFVAAAGAKVSDGSCGGSFECLRDGTCWEDWSVEIFFWIGYIVRFCGCSLRCHSTAPRR